MKSLNKTGMVVIDDSENMIEHGLNEDPPNFFKGNKNSEKSKTANFADMLHEINKKQNKKEAFESTHGHAKLKRNSFFS